MKFLKMWAVCIVLLFVFILFGGWMLFDFSHHPYIAITAIAFVLSALVCVLDKMQTQIDTLKSEIEELKKQVLTSESEDTVS